MAVEAKLVCRVHGRSDHQPRSRTLHGKAHGGENDRGQGESRLAHIAARHDCESDSGSGWTDLGPRTAGVTDALAVGAPRRGLMARRILRGEKPGDLTQWSGHAEPVKNPAIERRRAPMTEMRKETDSLGIVEVPADKLWGAQTQRSLEHFSIGKDLIPREMITSYAILKKAAAIANHDGKRLDDERYKLIVQVCDEILTGQHHDMFPLHVWMTGSGTQFNMNVNEVISNRCCQLAGTPLGSKTPVHPNDHVNMAQSSN